MDFPNLYCVQDIKSEEYFPPFVAVNDAVADRQFVDLLTDQKTVLSRHPEDYRLFRVGSFNPRTGLCFSPTDELQKVCVNPGFSPPGRPADVARAEEEGMKKFGAWLAARGLGEGAPEKARA